MQYLEAIQRAETDAADDVVAELEGLEFDDFFARNAQIRAEDHRVVHDSYLVEVKDPSEAEEEYDFTSLIETIPAAEAFSPVEDTACEMG
jgi:branched-chain amino acid transport system substrate-binding protein